LYGNGSRPAETSAFLCKRAANGGITDKPRGCHTTAEDRLVWSAEPHFAPRNTAKYRGIVEGAKPRSPASKSRGLSSQAPDCREHEPPSGIHEWELPLRIGSDDERVQRRAFLMPTLGAMEPAANIVLVLLWQTIRLASVCLGLIPKEASKNQPFMAWERQFGNKAGPCPRRW
jgi:hypothetical protein